LQNQIRPDIVVLTNVLISGMVSRIQTTLRVPVVAVLQGDDVFLESLPVNFRHQAIELIGKNVERLLGFLATSRYYAEFMANYLQISREKIEVIYPGIDLAGHGPRSASPARPFTIGYFARICPEKGLHVLAEAFRGLRLELKKHCRLAVSGWLGENQRSYFQNIKDQLKTWNLISDFDYHDCPDHASKVAFFQNVDVLSVPTVYREPKGLYILEAWANGVPVVQPSHGSFPELIDASGAGLLVNPGDPQALASGIAQLMDNPDLRKQMGKKGIEAVRNRFHAEEMARITEDYLKKIVAMEKI
jgi:glycosyltransferase involved in cell wall biosynthesis